MYATASTPEYVLASTYTPVFVVNTHMNTAPTNVAFGYESGTHVCNAINAVFTPIPISSRKYPMPVSTGPIAIEPVFM